MDSIAGCFFFKKRKVGEVKKREGLKGEDELDLGAVVFLGVDGFGGGNFEFAVELFDKAADDLEAAAGAGFGECAAAGEHAGAGEDGIDDLAGHADALVFDGDEDARGAAVGVAAGVECDEATWVGEFDGVTE